jgi:hypothetical protein
VGVMAQKAAAKTAKFSSYYLDYYFLRTCNPVLKPDPGSR